MTSRPKNSEPIDRSLVYFPLAIDCNKAVSLIINGWNRVVSDG